MIKDRDHSVCAGSTFSHVKQSSRPIYNACQRLSHAQIDTLMAHYLSTAISPPGIARLSRHSPSHEYNNERYAYLMLGQIMSNRIGSRTTDSPVYLPILPRVHLPVTLSLRS